MRIGYLLEQEEDIRRPPFNGPANHIRQVFEHLKRGGHDVRLLFPSQDGLWLTSDLREFERVRLGTVDRGVRRAGERVCRRIQSTLGLPYLGYFESRRFALACQQTLGDCDLFYERFSWMHYGGLLAARKQGIPWVVEFNGDPLADLEAKRTAPNGIQRSLATALTRRVLSRADRVVATGQGWLRNSIERWNVGPARAEVVENGTDLLSLLGRDDLRSFREETPEAETTIVYLGGFYPWHGIDRLLEAVAALLAEGVRLRLMLVGAGDGEDEARNLAKRLGVDGSVTFRGRMAAEAYAPVLADADIGVAPYCGWPEYSGLKIFDYKAAGLACVSSGENGRHPTLRHGETGWIVPPCNRSALADALRTLARDAELRRRLGRAARLDAELHHGWNRTVEGLDAVFRAVTKPGEPDSPDKSAGSIASGSLSEVRRSHHPAGNRSI